MQPGLLILGVVDVQVTVRMVCFESQKVVELRDLLIRFAPNLITWIRLSRAKIGIKSLYKRGGGLIVMKDIGTLAYKSQPCINMV
jgi:hypothetical protein